MFYTIHGNNSREHGIIIVVVSDVNIKQELVNYLNRDIWFSVHTIVSPLLVYTYPNEWQVLKIILLLVTYYLKSVTNLTILFSKLCHWHKIVIIDKKIRDDSYN